MYSPGMLGARMLLSRTASCLPSPTCRHRAVLPSIGGRHRVCSERSSNNLEEVKIYA